MRPAYPERPGSPPNSQMAKSGASSRGGATMRPKTVTEPVTSDDTIVQHFNSGLTCTLTGVALALTSVPYGSLELLGTVGPDARGRDAAPQRNCY